MNIKTSTFFIILITFFVSIEGLAQSAGDYQSNGSGDWNDPNTWQRYDGSNWIDPAPTYPTDTSGSITIRGTDIVTVTANVNIDETIVDSGGEIDISPSITLTIATSGSGNDLTNNGTITLLDDFFSNDGSILTVNGHIVNSNEVIINDPSLSSINFSTNSKYSHAQNSGDIPTATWASTSIIEVIGVTNARPGNLDQSFGNFEWNCTSQTTAVNLALSSSSTSFTGDFRVINSSGFILALSTNTDVTVQVDGDLTVSGSSALALTSTGSVTLNVAGNANFSSSGTSYIATSGLGTLDIDGDFEISSGTLNSSSNSSFNLAGNFTNNGGTYNANSSVITFDGSSTQTISGSNATIFYGMTTNNDINVEGDISLDSILIIGENVTFDADGTSDGGTFTLLSTSESHAASIFEIPSTSDVTGNVTVQRFINESNEYTYMAFPVNGLTVADLQNSFPITGPFTGSSGGSSPSFYYYDESVLGNLDEGWTNYPPTDNSDTIASTLGYASYMQGGGNTISIRGPINKGNVTAQELETSYNGGTSSGDDGWNLVANPFPCAINWNNSGWTKDNIEGVAYIWDGSSHDNTKGGWNGVIAPGQAFWVKADGNGTPTLAVTEDVKESALDDPFYRKGEIRNDMMIVSLENDKNTDKAYIYFKNEASNNFDSEYDAWKLSNSYFNISSYVREDQFLAANNIPLSECEKSIGLKIDNIKKGDYKLNFSNLEYFTFDASFKLVDHYLDTEVEIYDESVYDFSVNDDNGSYGKDRFELLVQPTSLTTPEITFEENILQSSAEDNNQWYRNGNVLEAATDQTLEVNETGVYHLVSSPFGCDMMAKDLIAYISDEDNEVNSCESKLDLITDNIDQGNYNLKIANLDLSDLLKAIKLVDRYKDKEIEINENFNYGFSVDNNVSSYENRFEIETVVSVRPEVSLEDNNLLVSNFDNSNQWFKDGKIIENATEKTYRATETGEYYVEVNKNGCVGKSNRVDVTVKITSLEDLIEDIKIYPNPSRDYLTIELPEKLNEEKIAIDFYDLIGRHCISKKLTSSNNKEIEIDISNLKKGIYNLSINGNNFSSNHKILKY